MSKLFPAIDRYIARLVIVPMIGVFVLASSLLVLDKLQRLLNFVAVQGGPASIVIKMLAALMPNMPAWPYRWGCCWVCCSPSASWPQRASST